MINRRPLNLIKLILITLIVNSFAMHEANARYVQESALNWQEKDFKNYLSKLVPSTRANSNSFEKLYPNSEINSWLREVDISLKDLKRELNIPKLDADFLFELNEDGELISLELAELRENSTGSVEKFQDFSSVITSWNAPPLPDSIPLKTKFRLNGKWLFVERPGAILFDKEDFPEGLQEQKLIASSQNKRILKQLEHENKLEIKLLSPSYIDFPRVGEDIVFELDEYPEKPVFQGKIIKTEKKKFTILTSKVKFPNSELYKKDFLWTLQAKTPDKGRNIMASISSGAITGISTVGIGPAISTNGIATAGGAVLGMLAGLMKEHDRVPSLNLHSGDYIKIEKEKHK